MRLTDPFEGDLPGKLKSARQAANLTTREVAERLQITVPLSHATVANYEKGKTQPTIGILSALADVYGRPVDWFMERSPALTGIRYRSLKPKVKKADRQTFEARAPRCLDEYVRIERRLGESLKPEVKFPPF